MIRAKESAKGTVYDKVFAPKRILNDALPEVWGEKRHKRDLMIAVLIRHGFSTKEIAGTKFPCQRQVQNRWRALNELAEYLVEERDVS